MRREAWMVILILLLAAAVAGTHITTTSEEYSRHNTGWNGTSGFAAEEVRDLKHLDTKRPLLILAPDKPFTAEEIGYLQVFLDSGGRLIIADEEGNANHLLTELGSAMRVLPGNLASLERGHTDPGLFSARVVGNTSLFAGVETVLVNRPAAVKGGEPLLETSILTWDDTDGDGRISGSESFGVAVICAQEGTLTVLGDPSLFINAMLARNPEFIKNLQAVQIDAVHSRTGTANPIINTILWIQETPLAIAAIAAVAILPVTCRFGRKRE